MSNKPLTTTTTKTYTITTKSDLYIGAKTHTLYTYPNPTRNDYVNIISAIDDIVAHYTDSRCEVIPFKDRVNNRHDITKEEYLYLLLDIQKLIMDFKNIKSVSYVEDFDEETISSLEEIIPMGA